VRRKLFAQKRDGNGGRDEGAKINSGAGGETTGMLDAPLIEQVHADGKNKNNKK